MGRWSDRSIPFYTVVSMNVSGLGIMVQYFFILGYVSGPFRYNSHFFLLTLEVETQILKLALWKKQDVLKKRTDVWGK